MSTPNASTAVTGPSPSADGGSVPTADRPNVVVIMVDDLPLMDDRLLDRLPTIKDLFLDHGVRAADYSGEDPLCCPGRASILTGQWAQHTGVTKNDARLFDPTESIATELSSVGYTTMIVGKYFNGTNRLTNFTPPGWTNSLIYSGGYRRVTMWQSGAGRQAQTINLSASQYTTDYIDQTAVGWINAAPANKPVFALITPYAIHSGSRQGAGDNSLLDDSGGSFHQPSPPDRYANDPRCADIPKWRPPNYNEADVSDKPNYIQALPIFTKYPNGWPLKKDCESLLAVDDLVRDVQTAMDAAGRSNTLYLFTSDNGMTFGAHRWTKKHVPYATPIPMFVYWPAVLGTAPATMSATMENVDVAPTICALAGCTMGPYPNGYGVDGISILPALLHGQPLGRDYVYQEFPVKGPLGMPAWWGARTTNENPLGHYVYTVYATGECELYNLTADPWELRNRCNKPAYKAIQAALASQVAAFRAH